jgi:hypothetical protein
VYPDISTWVSKTGIKERILPMQWNGMQLITQMENVSTILMGIRFSLMVWVVGLANKETKCNQFTYAQKQ